MGKNRRALFVAIGVLVFLLLLGCQLVGTPTPIVIVVTATPSHTPVIKYITVEVVVTATPSLGMTIPVETPTSAIGVTPDSTKSTPDRETTVPTSTSPPPTATPSPGVQPTKAGDALDDPATGLVTLANVAKTIQSQGNHTLRLTMKLSVPVGLTVMSGQQIDEGLTRSIRAQLSDYEIQGDFIIDISVDDLAQQKWVIDAFGATFGLGIEEGMEIRQSGDRIREKSESGEWISRELTSDQAVLPLGNSLVAIDAYGHALNTTDLVIDSLRPLLTGGEYQSVGWVVTDVISSGSEFVEAYRERQPPSSSNLKAVAAAFANSGLSTFVDPVKVTNGIQQITSVERAELVSDTRLVNHGQVEVRGQGTIEITYLMRQRSLDAILTLKTENSFEYLPSLTIIGEPH